MKMNNDKTIKELNEMLEIEKENQRNEGSD